MKTEGVQILFTENLDRDYTFLLRMLWEVLMGSATDLWWDNPNFFPLDYIIEIV